MGGLVGVQRYVDKFQEAFPALDYLVEKDPRGFYRFKAEARNKYIIVFHKK